MNKLTSAAKTAMNYDKQADYEEWSFERQHESMPIPTIEPDEDLEIASNISTDPMHHSSKNSIEPLSSIKSQIENKLKPVRKATKNEQQSLIQFEARVKQKPQSHFMGLVWCIVQGLSRGAMFSGQKVTQSITNAHISHIVLIRFLIIMLGAYIYGRRDGISFNWTTFRDFPMNVQKSLFMRSLYGFLAVLTAMVAIQLTPVSIAVSIMMTQVFASSVAGYILLNETVSALEYVCMVGGFVGVLVLTNDGLLGAEDKKAELRDLLDRMNYPHYSLGVFMGVLFTIFSALNFYEMRRMGNDVHSSIKTFYYGFVCSLFTLVYIIIQQPKLFQVWKIGTEEYPLSLEGLGACLIIGFFSWLNQESLSLALTAVKQGTASAFNNLALIVSFITDTRFFERELITQDIVGVSMIFSFSIAQSILSNLYEAEEVQEAIEKEESPDTIEPNMNEWEMCEMPPESQQKKSQRFPIEQINEEITKEHIKDNDDSRNSDLGTEASRSQQEQSSTFQDARFTLSSSSFSKDRSSHYSPSVDQDDGPSSADAPYSDQIANVQRKLRQPITYIADDDEVSEDLDREDLDLEEQDYERDD